MKILGDTRLYPPRTYAGAELAMHGILRHLIDQGHEATVIVREGDDGIVDGVDVFSVAADRSDDAKTLYEDADVVLSHMETGIGAQPLSALTGTPLVLLVHNEYQLTWSGGSPYCRLVVPNSHQLARKIGHQHIGIPSVVVNPPVYEDDCVLPQEQSLKPANDALQIGLSDLKGGHLFWRLSQREVGRRFLGVTGGYGEQIVRGGANVTVLPHQAPRELRYAYDASRVLLIPSMETWGRVAVEALANGMPIIAQPSDGLFDVTGVSIEAAYSGFVQYAYVGDPQGWSDALKALDDPDDYDRASVAARTRWAELQAQQEQQLASLTEALEALAE